MRRTSRSPASPPPPARGAALFALGVAILSPLSLPAQSTLGHSPNLRGAWTLAPGSGAITIGHRFEFIEGGDALLNVPTLSLGFGLPARLALGLDFTSNSEIVPDRLGGNETQFWLGVPVYRSARVGLEALAAWNSAARGFDAGLTARVTAGPVSLLAEARAFQDALGLGSAGSAGALGAVIRLTPHLEASGDLGRMLSPDSLDTVWSAGLAMSIPGTPHTLSFHATNAGAATLQGTSRPKVLGPESVRYGFVFTFPLGSWRQWGGIFRRGPRDAGPGAGTETTVELRAVAFAPREIRVRVGQRVEWVNRDPLVHTVTADDGAWDSGNLDEGARFTRVFDRPGRYSYHCNPHPQMTGVVIVEH